MRSYYPQKWQRIKFYLNHYLLLACLFLLIGCVVPEESHRREFESLEPIPPPNFLRGLTIRRIPQPLYPLRARALAVEGWTVLEFSVDQEGEVVGSTIRVIEEQPEGYFQRTSVNAARRMLFDNTREEVLDGIRFAFNYKLGGENSVAVIPSSEGIEFRELIAMRHITPDYPAIAVELGIEGYVIVSFAVTESGAVEDISIVESEPPGVFNDAAINAARRLRFEPRIISNSPVRVNNVEYRFDWQNPD